MEGAGKSTQLRLVAEALRGRGVEPIVTREPGGTAVGETLRELLLDERRPIGTLTELFLILAARAAFVEEVVAPALDAGRIVLTDRYDLSTLAYQGGGRGLDLVQLRHVNQVATGGIRPDLYIVLDVGVREGRARQRAGAVDRIESEEEDFHLRVAEAYRQLAESQANVALVDGRGEIEVVFRSVWQVLTTHFPETFPPEPG